MWQYLSLIFFLFNFEGILKKKFQQIYFLKRTKLKSIKVRVSRNLMLINRFSQLNKTRLYVKPRAYFWRMRFSKFFFYSNLFQKPAAFRFANSRKKTKFLKNFVSFPATFPLVFERNWFFLTGLLMSPIHFSKNELITRFFRSLKMEKKKRIKLSDVTGSSNFSNAKMKKFFLNNYFYFQKTGTHDFLFFRFFFIFRFKNLTFKATRFKKPYLFFYNNETYKLSAFPLKKIIATFKNFSKFFRHFKRITLFKKSTKSKSLFKKINFFKRYYGFRTDYQKARFKKYARNRFFSLKTIASKNNSNGVFGSKISNEANAFSFNERFFFNLFKFVKFENRVSKYRLKLLRFKIRRRLHLRGRPYLRKKINKFVFKSLVRLANRAFATRGVFFSKITRFFLKNPSGRKRSARFVKFSYLRPLKLAFYVFKKHNFDFNLFYNFKKKFAIRQKLVYRSVFKSVFKNHRNRNNRFKYRKLSLLFFLKSRTYRSGKRFTQKLFAFKKFNTFTLRYDSPFDLNFCYRLPKNFLLLQLKRKKKFFLNNKFVRPAGRAWLIGNRTHHRLAAISAKSSFSLFFSKLKKSRKSFFLTGTADPVNWNRSNYAYPENAAHFNSKSPALFTKHKYYLKSKTSAFLLITDFLNIRLLKSENLFLLKKTMLSFLYKNDLQRFTMRRYLKNRFIYFSQNAKSLADARFSSPYVLLENPNLASFFADSEFTDSFTQLHTIKWKRVLRNIDDSFNLISPVNNFSIKRVKFKPGYSTLWRNARTAFKTLLNLNFRYQRKLTRYVVKFYKYTRFQIFLSFEMQLLRILIRTKLLPDPNSSNLFLANGLVFVNGVCALNSRLPVFAGDVIQLVVHLKYYIVHRWLLNWNMQKKIRFKTKIKRKLLPKNFEEDKQRSVVLPKWVLANKYLILDIPRYLEVDYLTLSAICVYSPFSWNDLDVYSFFEHRFGIINMYNWKYIN